MSQQFLQTIRAPTYSDGDPNHRPDPNWRYPMDPGTLLQDIANKWMRKHLNDMELGKCHVRWLQQLFLRSLGFFLIILNAALGDYNFVMCVRV